TLALITPRGSRRSPWPAPKTGVSAFDGLGSFDAEKTELVTLPAIRTFMVPPFWANGSVCWVRTFVWGLAMVGGRLPQKTPLPLVTNEDGGTSANVNRLCAAPTVTLVLVTSPPIKTLPIERLTVTCELVASRWTVNDEIVFVLIVTLSIPNPNAIFRAPDGASSNTFWVWPPIEKLLILASSWPSAAIAVLGSSLIIAVKLVASPPIRRLP